MAALIPLSSLGWKTARLLLIWLADVGVEAERYTRVKQFVLFDNDGVLVDTERWVFLANQKALAEIGFSLDPVQYLEDMKHPGGSWLQASAAGIDAETLAQVRKRRNSYYQEFISTETLEIPGVVDVLRELQPHVRMGIVSTSKRADFELIHRGRGIMDFMEFALLWEDFEHPKPSPDPYLAGLTKFGARACDALVVEDSERGLRSAVAAGIECAIVHNDFTATHDFSAATHWIASIKELPALVLA